MDNKADQTHIAKVLQGDSSAFRVLVGNNKRIVYSMALRILKNEEDAKDAAQESFIKAYNQLHSFKGQSKFSTWLCSITYRICVSRLKKPLRESNSIGEEWVKNYPDDTTGPDKALTEKQRQDIIKKAIERLPPVDALLVTLYYFNENPVAELAEITGLTASNIKIKLFRARKILEQQLKHLM
jgi:RNA polymerase sigma-70 factor (ECF subfamily)